MISYVFSHPEGVYTKAVWQYLVQQNTQFEVNEPNKQIKSVSGQLSDLAEVGKIGFVKDGCKYKWLPYEW